MCYCVCVCMYVCMYVYIEHAIDCSNFIDDPMDVDMWKIIDFLESIIHVNDVRKYCPSWRLWVENNPSSIPNHHSQYAI